MDFDVEAEVLGMDAYEQSERQAQLERDRLLMEGGVMLPPQALPGS